MAVDKTRKTDLQNTTSKKMFGQRHCSIDNYNFLDEEENQIAYKTTITPFLGQKSKRNKTDYSSIEDFTMNSTKRTASTMLLHKLIDNNDFV